MVKAAGVSALMTLTLPGTPVHAESPAPTPQAEGLSSSAPHKKSADVGSTTWRPTLDIPVECAVGTECFIQKYMDHQAGPDRADYACGQLTTDAHDGTDFRVRSYLDLAAGIPVMAAADGVVRAVRDNMPDISVTRIGQDSIAGREAGNGVAITHPKGWETQYSHLRQGSILVTPGQHVQAGQVIGLMGLSGFTEYPHVHFSIRKDGIAIDPFTGTLADQDPRVKDETNGSEIACAEPASPMWRPSALRALSYQDTAILNVQFLSAAPSDPELIREGNMTLTGAIQNPPALVLWVDLSGIERNDRILIDIEAPHGTVYHLSEVTMAKSYLSYVAFAGRRRPVRGWQPGLYTGTIRIERNGTIRTTQTRTIQISE